MALTMLMKSMMWGFPRTNHQFSSALSLKNRVIFLSYRSIVKVLLESTTTLEMFVNRKLYRFKFP